MIFIFFIPQARIISFKVYPWNCIQMDTNSMEVPYPFHTKYKYIYARKEIKTITENAVKIIRENAVATVPINENTSPIVTGGCGHLSK